MGKSQRLKGANGERELVNLLKDELGIDFSRNLNQARDGGHDVNANLRLAIEVKRDEKKSLRAMWNQCSKQAKSDQVPVLAYRLNYERQWRFMLPMVELTGEGVRNRQMDIPLEGTATLYVLGFAYWVRENLEWLEK